MKNIAIFASGGGSNFKSIHHYIQSGEIDGSIVLTVSNNAESGAIKYARENNIPSLIINKVRHLNLVAQEEFLIQSLMKNEVDLICLAGYMKLLPKRIVHQYQNCILNIHPALLPQFGGKGFYGKIIHEAVIASGAEESGVTVHFVDEKYDHGKIVSQEKIEIMHRDTPKILAKRVLQIEHVLYPKVIKAFCEDRIIWENDHPKIEELIED
mgnify:CR=1 FL=1